MFSFRLSDVQREFRDAVRDFVAREVRPAANHPDRLQAESMHFVPAILEQASQMGLRIMALSEAHGGAGADHLTSCVVAEELAAGDIGFAATLVRTSELAHALFDRAMSDAQRETYLAAFLQDDAFHLAYAGADAHPGDGGWNYHRQESSVLDVPVTAVRRGSDWVLSGGYECVGNAPLAKLLVVRARPVAATAAPDNDILVLVPGGAAGMTVGDPVRADGSAAQAPPWWFHGSAGAVTFQNCAVPAKDVLEGCLSVYGGTAAAGRGSPVTQALNLGIGRAAYETAVDYAKIRVQGGRLIVEHQAIGTILAQIAIRLETARNLVWKAAWAADHPDEYSEVSDLPLQTMAKAYVSQAVGDTTLLAAECFGAMGVMKDMPLPKYVNDARIFVHAEPGNADATLRLAEAIAGFVRG